MVYGCGRVYTDTGHVYPEARWLPPDGVQRGTIFTGSGDPLTPGFASTSTAFRLDPNDPAQYITVPDCPNHAGESDVGWIVPICL